MSESSSAILPFHDTDRIERAAQEARERDGREAGDEREAEAEVLIIGDKEIDSIIGTCIEEERDAIFSAITVLAGNITKAKKDDTERRERQVDHVRSVLQVITDLLDSLELDDEMKEQIRDILSNKLTEDNEREVLYQIIGLIKLRDFLRKQQRMITKNRPTNPINVLTTNLQRTIDTLGQELIEEGLMSEKDGNDALIMLAHIGQLSISIQNRLKELSSEQTPPEILN